MTARRATREENGSQRKVARYRMARTGACVALGALLFLEAAIVVSLSGQGLIGAVLFSRDTVLAGDTTAAVDAAVAAVRWRDVTLRIVGHTAQQGDRVANVRLGAARAQKVAGALIDAGIPGDSIVWESAGGEAPASCGPGISRRACGLAQARAEIYAVPSAYGTVSGWIRYLALALAAIGVVIVGGMSLSRRLLEHTPWYFKALGVGLCAGAFSAALLSVGVGGAGVGAMAFGVYLAARVATVRAVAPDPWKGRNVSESLKERVDSARAVVERIRTANHRIPCPELSAALDSLHTEGRRIIGMLEQEPALARRSDRFLAVYLDGAAAVSEKYADIHRETDSVELDQSYREFLDRTLRTFKQQHKALIADDVLDLDVEIEVLTKRMASEGIK